MNAEPFFPIAAGDYVPPGEPLKPPKSLTRDQRTSLVLARWLNREIPPRDYLLGSAFSTSSRVLVFGETGVGKTLFALDLAGAIAAGEDFLSWAGQRPSRVMYLDGELPPDTFKERMELVAGRYTADIDLYGYNRFDLEEMGVEMPPLNTAEGEAWLMGEIDAIKPDAIVFDSIMCLLTGSMSEEESWAPIKALVRKLSARRIAQFWLHHTGHDATKSFGTKTREWEMDTVIALSKDDDSGAIRMEFKKARLRTPTTAAEFEPKIIQREDDGWTCNAAARDSSSKSETGMIAGEILKSLDRLADTVTPATGFDGAPVKKVAIDSIRDELRRRGYLELNEKGALTPTSRTNFRRAKLDLIKRKKIVEDDGLVWRI